MMEEAQELLGLLEMLEMLMIELAMFDLKVFDLELELELEWDSD